MTNVIKVISVCDGPRGSVAFIPKERSKETLFLAGGKRYQYTGGRVEEHCYVLPEGIKESLKVYELDFSEFPESDIAQKWVCVQGSNQLQWCYLEKGSGQPICTVLDPHLRVYEADLSRFFLLQNGKWLHNSFGTYAPGMTFILNSPNELPWERAQPSDFGIDRGDLTTLKGRFFISQKGKPCFDLTGEKPHVLVRDEWGGNTNRGKGYNLPKGGLFWRRASSPSGGLGSDYAVISI